MVAALSINSGGAVTAPSGWSLVGHTESAGVIELWTYYHVAGTSEPATFTWTTATHAAGIAGIAAYVGVDPASPLIGFSSATDGGGSATATAPSVASSTNAVALLFLTIDGSFAGTVTYPAGFTQRWALADYQHGYEADKLSVVSGNLSAATVTLSAVNFWSIQQIALRVGGGGPPPLPTVTSVTPGSGSTLGGTSVTVNGSGFQSGATVSFGGTPVAVATVTSTAITGTTAAHPAGAANVVVTNPDTQTGTCVSCFNYAAPAPAPTVTSVLPNSGSSAGGTAVTVNGSNFVSGATVSFGGSPVAISSASPTAISGTTAVHAAGAVNVVVTNPDAQTGTCIGCFTYVAAPPPTASSVTPGSGSTAGGTSVSVSGTGFQAGAAVSFGGSALTITNLTATAITGSTPGHAAGVVNVVVTNPDTQSGTCAGCYTYTGSGNAIQMENSLPGDPTWNDFATVLQDDAISGYGSKISLNHGDSIDFFITTTAATVSIDVFRTGWYGGVGARKMTSLGTFPGRHQAIPLPNSVTGIIDCSATWTKTTTLNIPANWVTGVYLAKLTASSGNQSFIFFVVRDDGGHEDFAFQTSVTTYQAYNTWGGTGLYNNLTNKSVFNGAHAVKVSFDRPFNPGDSNGAGHYLWFEYPMVRWAESQGFDMTYITDVDTHTNVNPLTNHKGFLSVGHDEYWSKGMRDNVQAAINAGVNVAFFSANSAYWQIRFEPNAAGAANRVEVGYKDFAIYNIFPGPDPMYGVNNAIVTNYWRDTPVNLPENALLGVQFGVQVNADYAYVVQNASHWIYAGTGFVNGTRVPGIVGYEVDRIFSNGFSPPGLVTLSNSPVTACCGGGTSNANSTIYTAASGARVFAAGTIQWSFGLDNYGGTTYVNAGIQRMTTNIFNNFRGL